ncbi:hypothetical protein C8R44DRAFT_750322 [Mycena epipterygia]|nr:hypothetical protein C8R44DRAFT_750322 [Mycena epipterygia]
MSYAIPRTKKKGKEKGKKKVEDEARGTYRAIIPVNDSSARILMLPGQEPIRTTVRDYSNVPIVLLPSVKEKTPRAKDKTEEQQTQLTSRWDLPAHVGRRGQFAKFNATTARNTQCRAARVSWCFLNAHRNNPFHWAEVWDTAQGFFVRHNLSALGQPLQLGHHGGPCNYATPPMVFEITAETGPQALQIQFCGHWKADGTKVVDRVDQLLNARLFPCTWTETQSAVTFNALKQFQLHHLESKVAAFDYCGSLRRLSDNSFTASVPDMYENFIPSSRMWGFLTTRKRLGQHHGIDEVLRHRPAGNLMVYCPSCPEPGFNMDKKMGPLPPELRHLNQSRGTADGNFHCTKSTKNTDHKDYSLYQGAAFFPTDQELKEHLEKVPVTKEAGASSHSVNNQDKKKFKNMEITGIVNSQCSHVFIKASVDLQYGERYANVDLALARDIRQKLAAGRPGEFSVEIQMKVDSVDHVYSYDAACQYSVNVDARFEKYFPDVAHIVKKMRWAVPAVHIQGHNEECMYKFATSYMLATGHFHGETAEVYWPELNQIGTQVCQQSGGHRQDTIMNHHNDWNYKKMAKAFALLLHELRSAELTLQKHRNNFLGLCATYAERITKEDWRSDSREPDTLDKKYTKSVYRLSKSKVPTQQAIYQLMLNDEAAIVPNTHTRRNLAATFLNEGIRIQREQLKIQKLVAKCKKHFSMTLKNDIEDLRNKTEAAISEWRKDQKSLMPAIETHLNNQPPCHVKKELLGLPSDLTEQQRHDLHASHFVEQEAQLREGAIYDALASVRIMVKAYRAMRDRKGRDDSGVYKNTLSQKQLNDVEHRRDIHIANYMAGRAALMRLGRAAGDETDFRELQVKDTAMKSRTLRRQLGDSRWIDGPIWAQGAVSVGARQFPGSSSTAAMPNVAEERTVMPGTQMTTRKRPAPTGNPTQRKKHSQTIPNKKRRIDGWIWGFQTGKMNSEELRKWSLECDRVQWFRAEAEMLRWLEQLEAKLAEWRTTIRSFAAYKDAWTKLAALQPAEKIGHVAYAKQKAAMFAKRELEGRTALVGDKVLGRKYGCIAEDDFDLVAFVTANRVQDAALVERVFQDYKDAQRLKASTSPQEEESESEDEWETDEERDSGSEEDADDGNVEGQEVMEDIQP